MKKKTKILSIVAALAVAMTALGGCGEKSDNDKLKISMLLSDSAASPYNSNWIALQKICELKNVEFDVQVVPASEYATKRSVVMQSGDIPDILTNTWANQVGQYAQDGLLLPVSDHLDKMPNLKKIIEEWDVADAIEDISEIDGKFYVLPAFEKTPVSTNTFAIRKDIFEKNNLKSPETYDELYDTLLKLKEIYPESLGLGDLYNGQLTMSFVASSFGTKGGYSLPYGYAYNYDKDEWYFAPISDEYKTLLTYMNKLYNAGCIDPEAFTQDSGQFKQKVLTNKYFIVPTFGQSTVDNYASELRGLGEASAEFETLYPLAGPTGIRKGKPCGKYVGGIAMPASVSKRSDFNELMEFVDWLYYSEEAALLTTIGVEGVTYTNNNDMYTLNSDILTDNNPEGTKQLAKDYGVGTMGFTTLVPDIVPEQVTGLIKSPKELEMKKYMIANDMVDKDDPVIKFTDTQLEQAKLLYTSLNDYTNSMIVKFIYGEESLDNWDAYVNKCKELGSDKLLELVKKAWKENNKK